MKIVKVLHIIPKFSMGGAERLVVNFLEAFDRNRFEVAVVSLYPETGTILEREIREKRLTVYYLNKHLGPDPRMILQLWRLFRTFRPDVVHTHLYVLRYTLLPALLCRIPVCVHTIHSVAQKEVNQIGKFVNQIAFRLAGVLPVSISREIAATVRSLYGLPIKIPVIYNGIPTSQFSSLPNQQGETEDVTLLHIGRFSPPKNHKLLIEAFALMLRECPKIHLWLVGDGELRSAVEKLVAEKGLQPQVSFLGICPNVAELLSRCDIFVLSSDWEGMPLTVLEAMAAGRAVISTSVGGVPELVEDGINGILVPLGDAEALAQAFLRLADEPELCRRMGWEGQKRVCECFDITKCAKEYEALYLNLLKENSFHIHKF